MKIAIDVSAVIYKSGVSQSVEKLVKAILEIDKENEYIFFGGSLRRIPDLKKFSLGLKGNFKIKFFPIPPTLADVLWNRLAFPKIEAFIGRHDVFHSSDWSCPPSNSFKVTTIHDLAPIKFPKLHAPNVVAAHKRRLIRVKKEVDRIIVPSSATKNDLVEMGFDHTKIRVIPWASVFKPVNKKAVDKVKNKYKIDRNYLLSIGVNPRKNTERIIEAFNRVRAGEELKLVIVGTEHMKVKEERNVRFVGNITDEENAALHTGASALIFPSLYEGFGMPILDAYNCGIPVVTSNLSSMPEIAGDAAFLVDPYDVDSIAKGISEVLAKRKTFVKKGYARAKKFTWEDTARKTIGVYKESL